MAGITSANQTSGKHAKIRSKKASTKIDMTPMVDLAFLLLTFFMLATTFNKPTVMKINMPEKNGEPPAVKPNNVLSLALADKNKILLLYR